MLKLRFLSVQTALFLGAFLYCWSVGKLGFFAFDQSIALDGGYRIAIGQVPYRDFVFSHGLPLFWLQGLVFKLLGVSFSNFLLLASLLSAITTVLVYQVIRTLFPNSWFESVIAALISAIWFWPPHGLPFPDPFAYFLLLVALRLSLSTRYSVLTLFLAGAFTVLAIVTKPTIGGLLAPLVFLIALMSVRDQRLRVFSFIFGCIITVVSFFLFLFYFSVQSAFFEQSLQIPFYLGLTRVSQILSSWGISANWSLVILTLLALLLFFLLFVLLLLRSFNKFPPSLVLAPLIILYVLTVSWLLRSLTFNNPSTSYPLIGVVFGLTAALVKLEFRSRAVSALIACMVLLTIAVGHKLAHDRLAHEGIASATSFYPVALERLKPLAWAEPTMSGSADVSLKDLKRLVEYLVSSNAPFFIFPDSTFLYAAVGSIPPQPVLWFHAGLTYPRVPTELDTRILNALKDAQVKLIVIERDSFFGTKTRLADFPQLETFIDKETRIIQAIGNFEIRAVTDY